MEVLLKVVEVVLRGCAEGAWRLEFAGSALQVVMRRHGALVVRCRRVDV